MYDINLKNVKKEKNIFIVFLLVGILFFIVLSSVLIFNFLKVKRMDSFTVASSIEVSEHYDSEDGTMYSPHYHYRVGDNEFVCDSNYSSSSYPNKNKNKVYYNSNNPSECVTEYDKSKNYFWLLFLIIPTVFIIIGWKNIKKVNDRVKIILELNQRGRLVKKLPYRLEDSNVSVNDVPLKKPVVDYVLPTGEKVELHGEPRHDRKHSDEDGFVDLLIDEQNPNNYFIDFEINRLSGNMSSDYYRPPYQ